MNRVVRRRLEMAVRVRDFSRAHPSADANYGAVLGRLEERIAKLEELAKQQQGGFLVSRAAARRRRQVRRRIHHELLRHLVTVADVAAAERPPLGKLFRMPRSNATNEAFRTLARTLLEQGQAERELLAKHGLSERLLDDLASALDEFDASVAESNQGRREHVGARAEMKAVSDEVMQIVELLDGLNRYRFGADSPMRAAWDSARNLVSGPVRAGGDAPPAAGEVMPAA